MSKKLTKKQGINALKKILKSRNIPHDVIDLEALYDSSLTYSENKKYILGILEADDNVADEYLQYLYDEFDAVSDKRSTKAHRMDSKIKAKKIYSWNERGIKEWIKAPNRVDLKGVDVFEDSKSSRKKGKLKRKKKK